MASTERDDASGEPRPAGVRNLATALIVVLILALAAGLVLPAIQKARDQAARTTCINNLHQLGLSANNFASSLGYFPPAAEPNPALPPEQRLSWIVHIFPYIESTDLFRRMDRDKGWEAEENRYLALTPIHVLKCPGCPERLREGALVPTHYVGIAGPSPAIPT